MRRVSVRPTLKPMFLTDRDVLLTLVSTAFSVIFTIVQVRKKKLCYCLKTVTVVDRSVLPLDNLSGGLTILYDGRQINKLQLTEVFLWNSGSHISGATLDVKEGHNLRICLTSNDGHLFEHRPPVFRDPTGVAISRNTNNELRIAFKFLNHGDGFAVTIAHVGDIDVLGEIQEAGRPERKDHGPGCIAFICLFSLLPLSVVAMVLDFPAFGAFAFVLFLVGAGYLDRKTPFPRKFRRFLVDQKLRP